MIIDSINPLGSSTSKQQTTSFGPRSFDRPWHQLQIEESPKVLPDREVAPQKRKVERQAQKERAATRSISTQHNDFDNLQIATCRLARSGRILQATHKSQNPLHSSITIIGNLVQTLTLLYTSCQHLRVELVKTLDPTPARSVPPPSNPANWLPIPPIRRADNLVPTPRSP